MGNLSGLWRRGNVWQYRRRIPSDVARLINRHIVSYSLNTSNYSTARTRCRTAAHSLEQYFQSIREGDLNAIPDGFKLWHKTVAHVAQNTAPPSYSSHDLKPLIEVIVKEVIGQTNNPPPELSITIKELYERYMTDPALIRSPKTILTYESVYRALVEMFGEDRLINDISRDDCRAVLEIIRYLPANAKKKYPKKSLMDISSMARDKGMKPMAPLTINKYLSKLSALLNWAMKEDYLDRNPAKGLQVNDPVHKQDKRLPFSDHQLKRIFAALETGHTRGSEYWVPYIGLYNGMRLNEICQLNVEDIQLHDDIICFAITRDANLGINDKQLKTKSSERIIPIHPHLMDIGFTQYLKNFKNRPRSKLFPDIPLGTTGYRSDTFSKQFRRFLKTIDADADRTSFHSFRHNFRDAMREANIRHEIAMRLGGWSDSSQSKSSQAFYGKGYMMKAIVKELEKVHFAGIGV